MRKIISSTYISLDGVVELPHEWPTIERPSDERGGQLQTSLLFEGRVPKTKLRLVDTKPVGPDSIFVLTHEPTD